MVKEHIQRHLSQRQLYMHSHDATNLYKDLLLCPPAGTKRDLCLFIPRIKGKTQLSISLTRTGVAAIHTMDVAVSA